MRSRWPLAAAGGALMISTLACGDGADDAAARTPAEDAAPAANGVRADTFEVAVDPSALSTAPLEREAFIADACSFATADEIAAFFAFDDGPVAVEGDDGVYAGTECSYTMQGQRLAMALEVQFSQRYASSTED
ncbi:MAG: hypothetical protein RLN75_00970, partial [Longimicrobiales bacterium]